MVTRCAIWYQNKLNEVRKSGLSIVSSEKIINDEEEKFRIFVNTILIDTKRGDLDASNLNHQSPVNSIEPLICEF